MDVRMDGRVAVITGSSTGLGLAMAKEFAASGASVALLARKMDALTAAKAEVAKAAGKTNAKIEAYSCDVAKAQPIADTWKKVVADFGKVDIVVNNAGISHAKAFDTVTDEDWQGDLDLKLFAAIRLLRLALPGMRERKWGRVVNVLNIGAKAPGADSTPTSVSRAAGLALTKALSKENAPHNVLVNAMLVGLIESDQWQRRHKAANDGKSYEQFLERHGQGPHPDRPHRQVRGIRPHGLLPVLGRRLLHHRRRHQRRRRREPGGLGAAPKIISLPNEVGEVAPSYGDGGVRRRAPILGLSPPSAAGHLARSNQNTSS